MHKLLFIILFTLTYSIAHAGGMLVGGSQSSAIVFIKGPDGFGEISTESNAIDFKPDLQNYLDALNPTKYSNYGYISFTEDKVRGFDWSWGFEASNAYLNEQLYGYDDELYQSDLGTAIYLRRYGITIPLYYRFNNIGSEYIDLGYVFGVNTYNFDGDIYLTSECIVDFESGLSENQLQDRIKSSCPLKRVESIPVKSTNEVFISQGFVLRKGLMNDMGLEMRIIQETAQAKSKKFESSITNRFFVVGIGFTISTSY